MGLWGFRVLGLQGFRVLGFRLFLGGFKTFSLGAEGLEDEDRFCNPYGGCTPEVHSTCALRPIATPAIKALSHSGPAPELKSLHLSGGEVQVRPHVVEARRLCSFTEAEVT